MYFEIGDYNALREALKELCVELERDAVPSDAVFASRLVANELLSNVLQHGGGRAYFSAVLRKEEIVLSVRGENGFCPPETSCCSAVEKENGRGLFLVDAYCFCRHYSEEEGIRVVIRTKEKPSEQ